MLCCFFFQTQHRFLHKKHLLQMGVNKLEIQGQVYAVHVFHLGVSGQFTRVIHKQVFLLQVRL